ncbi:hypothetical protein V0U79_03915 [Hyphobacterium sp. HN65]|uniref:Uncharacterized protein n=1 Tax=Hyphobacterium lacteum TaxID=3116575 RepID=A0ABU7LNK9_9PROT|nr:hypothetical protein [Hyphobacterium sp. HN65]MEE2525499.1 hypothetical protein [Hyphobacterium sp. HN65]
MAREIRIGGVPTDSAANAANIAVRDWLETQARIAAYWRDILVDQNGDLDLIEALDAHALFLRSATG